MTPRHTLLAAALAAAFASAHAADLQLDQARQPLANSLQQLARQAGSCLDSSSTRSNFSSARSSCHRW